MNLKKLYSFLVGFLLINPLYSAEFYQTESEVIEQADALVVNEPDQPLLLTAQRVRRQNRCNSNCLMGGLEIVAGAGIATKGVGFVVFEDDQSATEKSFIILPDILLGILLMIDGICRLFPRNTVR